jgi:hypothetical protein
MKILIITHLNDNYYACRQNVTNSKQGADKMLSNQPASYGTWKPSGLSLFHKNLKHLKLTYMQGLAIFSDISTSRTLLIPVQLPMVKVLGLCFPCHSRKEQVSNGRHVYELHVACKE